MSFAPVEQALADAVARGVFPGAVLLVRDGGRVVYLGAVGCRSLEPERTPMHESTIFDLSSLTKPLATTTAMMILVRDGRLRVDDRVSRFFHNFGVHGKTHVTFRHLLSHCSGLPAWRAFFKEILDIERKGGRINFIATQGAKEHVYHEIQRLRLEAAPGERAVYSDIGFMLLGAAVEEIAGVNLDRFCQEKIFRPLGLRATAFVDLTLLRTRRIEPITEMIAPTEHCSWRKRVVCGEVHDDNAYAMGGIAGHAGLFASIRDVDALLVHLKECHDGGDGLIPPAIVREFWTRDGHVAGSTWSLGWDGPAAVGSSAGSRFSARTVGHLGFTGTSMWLDLERNRHVVLLSNRVHPSRDNEAIKQFRPLLHDLVNQALGA